MLFGGGLVNLIIEINEIDNDFIFYKFKYWIKVRYRSFSIC